MYDNLTVFEEWVISQPFERIPLLVVAKWLSGLFVPAVVVIPCIVTLLRPMRFLWMTTRLRAGILSTASAIWLPAEFWAVEVNGAVRTIGTIGPVELPPAPLPRPLQSPTICRGASVAAIL